MFLQIDLFSGHFLMINFILRRFRFPKFLIISTTFAENLYLLSDKWTEREDYPAG